MSDNGNSAAEAIEDMKFALYRQEYEKAKAILTKKRALIGPKQYEYWKVQIEKNQKNSDMKNPTLARGLVTFFLCIEILGTWIGSFAIMYVTNSDTSIFVAGLVAILAILIVVNRSIRRHYANKYGIAVFREKFGDLNSFMRAIYFNVFLVLCVYFII